VKPIEPKLIPEPVEALPDHLCAPNLAYYITRTSSNELPVYQLRKRGGNLKMTRIKKIDGRPETLRDELQAKLGLQEKEAVVNAVTKHVVLKGFWKNEVDQYLRERRF
jgi:large subunit ribosomal protein L49